MKLASIPPYGVLEFTTPTNAAHLSRQAKAGAARRLTHGVYVVGATLPVEAVTRHHLWDIVAHFLPDAVIVGKSALAGGLPVDGVVYIGRPQTTRRRSIVLPDCRIEVVVAPAALPGDTDLPSGLHLSGPARCLVENVSLPGRPPPYRAGASTIEDRIDEMARTGGDERVRRTLDQIDTIAGNFDPRQVDFVKRRLVAVLGTTSDDLVLQSSRLTARVGGLPYDAHRLDLIDGLVQVLQTRAPSPVSVLPPLARLEWLAFFEAYFSNFIEGTLFDVDEARRIAIDGYIPETRPADAHDVAATFRLAADATDRTKVPATSDDLIDILRERHGVLMAARADKRPGEFKIVANRAGSYYFVEPGLVAGTLAQGFERMRILQDPFARATAMMLLVTECHPFDDGNGRLARLMANAELSYAGQVRFVIPTVYRSDYLASLRGLSNGAGQGQSLIAVLDFAQRWTSAVDWFTYEDSKTILTACNAFDDDVDSGAKLEWPNNAS